VIQLQTLNYLIKTQDASLITLNGLDKSFFSSYPNEFNFIKSHLDTYGKVPDVYTVASKFPNFDIIEVNESPKYLLTELYNDKNTRNLASVFGDVKQLLMAGKVDEAMQRYLKASETMSTEAVHLEAVNILKDTKRYDSYLERSEDFKKFYVSTGFKELDDVIGGWDRREELATIIARPNVGKSWILLKVALAAAKQGLRVGLYSGEMSEDKVGYRLDTLAGGISNYKLIHGDRSVQNEYKKFIENELCKITGELLVITPAMIGGAAGVTALRAFIEKEKLDMLCIDQHSLLEDDRGARDPVQRASNISRDLKNLQVMKKIPFISVSQGNRGINETGTMGLENIAQSDRIGQDSTVVVGLDQKDGILTMKLLKSRDSENGKQLKYRLGFDTGSYEFIPNEDDATGGAQCEEVRQRYECDYDTGSEEF
jgi:replicative DNA helicase